MTTTRRTFDPRWEAIAKTWLEDSEVPGDLIEKHWRTLAQRLQDIAEEMPDEIAECEVRAFEAARDAYWERKIDEAREA